MAMGTVHVDCVEDTCIYNSGNGRCIAEHVSMVFEVEGFKILTCGTYEDRELAYDPPWGEDFIDWGEHDMYGDRD